MNIRFKIKSSLFTALFETLLYSIGVSFFILIDVALGLKNFSIHENNNIRDCTITFLVVFASIFTAKFMGASSFLEVWKNGESRDVSITMAVGCCIGLITYLLLTVIK